MSDIYSGIPSGIQSGIYSDILSDIYFGILSAILSGIHTGIPSGGRGPAVLTELGRSPVEAQRVLTAIGPWRLRSSSAHCDPELANKIGEKLGEEDWRHT